jgi:hypothetical protein
MQHVLCRTNGLCLKAMFGDKLADWIGKRVIFFAGQWNGEECVRVYGSPDIAAPMTIQIQLPRRKAFPMTMHTSAKDGAAPAKAAPQPSAEHVGFETFILNEDAEPPEGV